MIEQINIKIYNYVDSILNIKINIKDKSLYYNNKYYLLNTYNINNLIHIIMNYDKDENKIIDNILLDLEINNNKKTIISNNLSYKIINYIKEITNE